MANLITLASGLSVTLAVTEGQTIVLNNGISDVARLSIATGAGAGRVVTASHNGRRVYGPFAVGSVTVSAISGSVAYELSGDVVSQLDDDYQPLTGLETGTVRALVSGVWILNGASAGQDSGWLSLIGGGFRLSYALDSGTASTTFSVDISADGSTSLGQAFTGTWASSTAYEDTGQRLVSNVAAKFFRFNVLSGGPLSVQRLA